MSKRAAQGAGTIRKKTVVKNGKEYIYWEARITTGYDPGTGKQRQRSFTGKTQKEVREKLQAAAVSLTENTYFEPNKITVAQWFDLWLSEYMGDKKYSTVRHYKAQCKTHIIPALGAIKLCDLTTPQIQAFYNTLGKTGKAEIKKDKSGKKTIDLVPLSVKSIRNIHGILIKSLNTAVDVKFLKQNPAEKITLPRKEQKEINPLSDEQIKLFLSECEKDSYKDILKTILFCGLRESEAIGLTWDCIDFNSGTIRIYRQLQRRPKADGGYIFTTLKNDKTRTIKPAPYVISLLKQTYKLQTESRIKAGIYWEGWQDLEERKTAFVFTNEIGDHLHPQTVYNHYKKIAALIGVPESRVHDLRHTFAVLSLQNGDDIKTVQENLGHATASFTLDVYGHVSERMKEESSNRMQQYISAINL